MGELKEAGSQCSEWHAHAWFHCLLRSASGLASRVGGSTGKTGPAAAEISTFIARAYSTATDGKRRKNSGVDKTHTVDTGLLFYARRQCFCNPARSCRREEARAESTVELFVGFSRASMCGDGWRSIQVEEGAPNMGG